MKFAILILFLCSNSFASGAPGLPPTSVKGPSDTSPVTTFETIYTGAGVTVSHSGVNATVTVSGAGGTGTVTWKTKTANYGVLSSDSGIICGTATSAAFTLTMPAANTVSGQLYFISNNSSYTITITPTGSDSIFNGGASTSQSLLSGGSVILISDGSSNYNAF